MLFFCSPMFYHNKSFCCCIQQQKYETKIEEANGQCLNNKSSIIQLDAVCFKFQMLKHRKDKQNSLDNKSSRQTHKVSQ